ncbi:hypothetical protein TNCV_3391121 [Trichonephila clavipes]|nr:hypothetical protein TNCV_3391121 [Trichonephila clavipes]
MGDLVIVAAIEQDRAAEECYSQSITYKSTGLLDGSGRPLYPRVTSGSWVEEIFRGEGYIEDFLHQLEGSWLSEDDLDDENSDDEYHDADDFRIQ